MLLEGNLYLQYKWEDWYNSHITQWTLGYNRIDFIMQSGDFDGKRGSGFGFAIVQEKIGDPERSIIWRGWFPQICC